MAKTLRTPNIEDLPNKIQLSQLEDGKKIKKVIEHYESSGCDGILPDFNPDLYRKKSESIVEEDLDDDVLDKLNYVYDDSYVRNRISIIEGVLPKKVDKCDLLNYRKKSELITKEDLDEELLTLISTGGNYEYDDTEIREMITEVDNRKVDKLTVGDLSNINPELQQFLPESFNIVDAINFLFEHVNYTTKLDFGLITTHPTEVVDYGLITSEVDITDKEDYGLLISN